MVTASLSNDLIAAGEAVLRELDATDKKAEGALWFFFPEERVWKLLFFLPNVEKDGPKAAYAKIQSILAKLPPTALTLDDIAIVRPDAPLLKLLRSAIRTGPGISGIRFSNNMINGNLISDSYIYRLV